MESGCSSPSRSFLSSFVVLCCLSSSSILVSASSPPVTVSLTARWSQTPLLLETAQFLSREQSQQDLFWNFVEATTSTDFTKWSDVQIYQWIIDHNIKSLQPRVLEALKFSLAVRFDSPAIAMYQQMSSAYAESRECEAFLVVKNSVTCDFEKISQLIDDTNIIDDGGRESAAADETSHVFDFDHLYPSKMTTNSSLDVILFANLGTSSFKSFHHILTTLSLKGKVKYYLRYFVKNISEKALYLSGYGVELAIKSTEYKARDSSKDSESSQLEALEKQTVVKGFDFKKLKELHPDLKDSLNKFHFHLIQESEGLKPLKVWELSDLSYQAVQKIKENEVPSDALSALTDYAQNLPLYANELSQVAVTPNLRGDVTTVQSQLDGIVSEGSALMMLNGLQLDIETLDPFTLVDLFYKESKILSSLFSFGIPRQHIQALLNLNIGVQAEDEYAIDIRDDAAVKFINDLESDQRYSKWPKSLQYLLQPTFPGTLRRLARNIHYTILVIDPSDVSSLAFVSAAHYFVANSIPTRIGFVFVQNPQNEINVMLTRVLGFIISEDLEFDSINFLKSVYASVQGEDGITKDIIETAFNRIFKHQNFEEIISDENFDEVGRAGREFYQKSGLGPLPVALYNGKPIAVSHVNNLEEVLVGEVYSGTFFWQKAIWEGDVDERTNLLDYVMDQSYVMPRLNDRVLKRDQSSKYLEFAKYTIDTGGPVSSSAVESSLAQLSQSQLTEFISDNMLYVAKKNVEFEKGVTLWIAADFEDPKSRELTYQALKYLKKSDSMRIGFLFNHDSSKAASTVSDAVLATLLTQNNLDAKLFITKLVKEEHVEALNSGAKTLQDLEVGGMKSKEFHEAFNAKDKLKAIYKKHALFCDRVLKISNSEQMLIANGKFIGPFKGSEEFTFDDFGLVDKYINVLSAKEIIKTLKLMRIPEFDGSKLSDLAMKITATLLKNAPESERMSLPNIFKDRPSVIHLPTRESQEPYHKLHVIIEPLSRAAQKVSPILERLHKIFNTEVSVFMNCVKKWSDMPLNSFYRFVLPWDLEFDQSGRLVDSRTEAKFAGLPKATLLTLNMQTPESWLVEAVATPYDLDNLLLQDLRGVDNVKVNYELAHILLEGHCYDKQTGQPPRGLQFTLGTTKNRELYDTIVMANLGYFQLKANPGSWLLNLRRGPSKEIYEIASTKGTSTPFQASGSAVSNDIIVCMRSFTNKFIHIFVSKKPGMQNKDVLGEAIDDGSDRAHAAAGIWDSVNSFFGGGTEGNKDSGSDDCADPELTRDPKCSSKDKEADVLNIFSVASGHLYERFMRVMMLSVLKNTKTPVKFWFLKNFLSPSFKDSLDNMKEHYSFEYELVEYKWPRWLNQQTDKQRTIWGYKILFLDVLFPLSVKKIIFVDADQIVRADLRELRDFNLEGAPYGYTPFCDDRTEMEGFRFWKSGYWASHLAGRRYHISALYVIDLQKFRKIAAGDRLRGQYQGLSQDPNSLANLDQDLPNNMIHQVRIKSLPMEWLWCETWCSDESLSRAKTIDLCNNPLTKEPKLDRAMRIVPEWKDYDAEIRNILQNTPPPSTGTSSEKLKEQTGKETPDTTKAAPKKHSEHVDL